MNPWAIIRGWMAFASIGLMLWASPSATWAQEIEAPPPPQGKGWIFLPSVGLSEIVTDNVNQASASRQADLITIINPGLQITGDTARIKATINLQPQFQKYLKTSNQDYTAFNLFGTGEATLVQDLLFFDAAASGSQSNINGGQGFTNQNLVPGSQRTQVLTANLGPVVRTDIGTLAHAELLYQFSTTRFTNNTTVAGTTGLSNTTQNEGRATVGTGEDFGRLNSTLVLDYVNSSGGGVNSSSTDKRFEVDNRFAVDRKFSLIVQLGYEDQTFPGSTAGNIRGPIAQGGLSYTANPDTSVDLLYGRRQGSDDFNGNLKFAVTPATKVYITYTQTVQTTQQLIQQNLANAGSGPGGTVINPATGLPFPIVNPNFPLQNNVFRFRSLTAGVTSEVGRNTFTLTAYHEEETSLAGVSSSNGTSFGGSFQWSREMSPRMTGMLFAGYAANVGSGGGTGNISASINYLFTNTLHGAIRYDFIDGNGGIALNGATGGRFTQNALTFTLVKTF